MSLVQKLHKRVEFKVPEFWDERRKEICTEAKSSASMVVQSLLKDAKIEPGDSMTVDVRVLIERNY